MLSSNIIIIFFSLVIFGLLIYSLIVNGDTVKEGWVDYKQLPFGNIQSGAGSPGVTPLVFHEYPIYSIPYNYPICHLVD